jgi:hypothetical protein
MKEAWISAFIDDELKLDEKIGFVESVHANRAFKDETVALLQQERLLRGDPVGRIPPMVSSRLAPAPFKWLRPLILGLGSVAVLLFLWIQLGPQSDTTAPVMAKTHRFVIYHPGLEKVEISGSFTDWQPVEMERIGTSGYWEAQLKVTAGEHRFAYILDGSEQIPDPTVRAREKDDFGGQNSILTVQS